MSDHSNKVLAASRKAATLVMETADLDPALTIAGGINCAALCLALAMVATGQTPRDVSADQMLDIAFKLLRKLTADAFDDFERAEAADMQTAGNA